MQIGVILMWRGDTKKWETQKSQWNHQPYVCHVEQNHEINKTRSGVFLEVIGWSRLFDQPDHKFGVSHVHEDSLQFLGTYRRKDEHSLAVERWQFNPETLNYGTMKIGNWGTWKIGKTCLQCEIWEKRCNINNAHWHMCRQIRIKNKKTNATNILFSSGMEHS